MTNGAVSDHPIDADDFVGSTQWETDAGEVDVLVTATGPHETIRSMPTSSRER